MQFLALYFGYAWLSRFDFVQSWLLTRSPEWGVAPSAEGDVEERRGMDERRPAPSGRSEHLELFVAGLAEGAQRVWEPFPDRVCDA